MIPAIDRINYMLITNKNSNQTGIQKRSIPRVMTMGPISFRFATMLLIATLILSFIGVQSQAATKSYTVYGLQNTIKDLERENEQLKAEATRLKAVNQIGAVVTQLNLEPINSSDVSYDAPSQPGPKTD